MQISTKQFQIYGISPLHSQEVLDAKTKMQLYRNRKVTSDFPNLIMKSLHTSQQKLSHFDLQ